MSAPLTRLLRSDIAWIVILGVVLRLVLLALGRVSLVDGFYLQAAVQLGSSAVPYEDFTQVAFPWVEWCYAWIGAVGDPLAAASLVTGAVVVATAAALATLCRPFGRVAAIGAGGAYMTAAPVIAFHAFERELWSAFLLTVAAVVLLASARRSDGRTAAGGLVLAAAMLAKLTAAIGVLVLLAELLLRRRARDVMIAAITLGMTFLAATLVMYGRHGDEFAAQVFLFYFLKGESFSSAQRLVELARSVDVNLAIGTLAMLALWRRSRGRPPLRMATLWLGAYLVHYAFFSPSFWDHNAIDLAAPAAIGTGLTLAACAIAGRIIPVGIVFVGLIAGARGLAPDRPVWFPHGLGGTAAPRFFDQLAVMRDHSSGGDLVVPPTPLAGAMVPRRAFVNDFELEPVARAVLAELRAHGLLQTLARRDAGPLGVPPGVRLPFDNDNLFLLRRDAGVLLYVMPRLRDAIDHREIALLVIPEATPLQTNLKAAGYRGVTQGLAHAFVRP